MTLGWTLLAAFLILPGQTAGPAPPPTVEITIEAIAFEEVTKPLKVGDIVEWINKDVVAHTATAKNGDWHVVIPPNAKARIVLKKAGTVDYFCEYHPNMTGRLIVGK